MAESTHPIRTIESIVTTAPTCSRGRTSIIVLGLGLTLILCGRPVAAGYITNSLTPPHAFGAGKPYAIIQLGDDINPLMQDNADDDQLNIESNSSVFGSTLKGSDFKDAPDFKTQLSSSKVTGSWDIESGVVRDETSSFTGSQNSLTTAQMNQVREDALSVSNHWASQTSINFDPSDLDGINNITLTGGGVFASTKDFKVNGQELILDGDEDDFYVFNILADQEFLFNSKAVIRLLGDITPEDVFFNILGDVNGGGKSDATLQSDSIFAGTLFTQRNISVSEMHFYTEVDSGFMDNEGGTQAPSTLAVTYEQAIWEFDGLTNSGIYSRPTNPQPGGSNLSGGVFGQIIGGAKINWSESDIAYHPWMPPIVTEYDTPKVPEPFSLGLMGFGALGIGAIVRRRKQPASTQI